jgi:hypothetical protein
MGKGRESGLGWDGRSRVPERPVIAHCAFRAVRGGRSSSCSRAEGKFSPALNAHAFQGLLEGTSTVEAQRARHRSTGPLEQPHVY